MVQIKPRTFPHLVHHPHVLENGNTEGGHEELFRHPGHPRPVHYQDRGTVAFVFPLGLEDNILSANTVFEFNRAGPGDTGSTRDLQFVASVHRQPFYAI